MSLTLATNTMRYGFDSFRLSKVGIIIPNSPLSATGVTDVEGFNITGEQPEGTGRYFLFCVDDKLYRLTVADSSSGAATPEQVTISESEWRSVTSDEVIEKGNTAEDLTKVKSIVAWVGKNIYPIIVLTSSDFSGQVVPSCHIGLKLRSNNDLYKKTVYSGEYNLLENSSDSSAEIISIDTKTTCVGGGTVTISVSIKDKDGTWGDWTDVDTVKNATATGVKFKYDYSVPKLDGSASAKVDSVSCFYTTGSSSIIGSEASIITKTQEYKNDIHYTQCVITHKPIIDSTLQAYVSLRRKPKHRENITVGYGTGAEQSITLGHNDTNINPMSLKIFVNGKSVGSNFSFNTINSSLTITADNGALITASYDYEYDYETWIPMTKVTSQIGEANDESKFEYVNTDDNRTITTVKVTMNRPTGVITNGALGTGNGRRQMFLLDHKAKDGTVVVHYNGQTADNWSYDKDTNIITLVAPDKTDITVNYDWIAETGVIDSMYCGWSE